MVVTLDNQPGPTDFSAEGCLDLIGKMCKPIKPRLLFEQTVEYIRIGR